MTDCEKRIAELESEIERWKQTCTMMEQISLHDKRIRKRDARIAELINAMAEWSSRLATCDYPEDYAAIGGNVEDEINAILAQIENEGKL